MKYFIEYLAFSASLLLYLSFCHCVQAQIAPGVYMSSENEGNEGIIQKLSISENYLIHNTYRDNPAEFVSTWGGFYKVEEGVIKVKLEFNSKYEDDKITEKEMPIKVVEKDLILGATAMKFAKVEEQKQGLDGYWLFATRGPDTGQERRGDDRPRKTLKVLMDGTFQWIAYNTESYKFFGTGGGSYTSANGVYTENIEFFSRDNSRVGAKLQFDFELKGNDWHHTGKNSRGEPLYEIWTKR